MAVLEVPANRLSIKRVAVAGAATVVWPQNRIAAGGPRRLVIKKDGTPSESIGRFRSTVQLHDERISRSWFVIERIGQHAFDADTVRPFPFDALLARQREVAIEIIVDPRHASRRRLTGCPRPDVSDAGGLVDDEHVAACNGAPIRRHESVVPLRDLPRFGRRKLDL